ncbi:transmembrane protease serine 9-like [Hylaeus volcanicus]|uniref:transmembrane protease serine 9-like n=1 Tax=Hylaeus volcanicus TaxID=313075 RepID=UPI0023B7C904|nr:transmembrane protease serine 9-like [Hylaeus volcanicus]
MSIMSSNFVCIFIFAVLAFASAEFPQDRVVAIYADVSEVANDSKKLSTPEDVRKLLYPRFDRKLADTENVENSAAPEDMERIVGGYNAQLGQFPYTVSLRVWNQHICGGSILNNNHILTAAHCVTAGAPNINDMTVVSGTIYLKKGGESHKVAAMYYIKDYPLSMDVGVIKIFGSINFNTYQQPIALASSRPPTDYLGTVSGWGGITTSPSQLPDIQQFLTVKIIDSNKCRESYSDITTEICTLNTVNQGVCSGDSGGPLVFNGQVVGIVSRSVLCAKGYPDIFTSVYDNLSFIRAEMNTYWRALIDSHSLTTTCGNMRTLMVIFTASMAVACAGNTLDGIKGLREMFVSPETCLELKISKLEVNADEPEKLGSPANAEKIVGGGYAELGQFSYVVSIRLNHVHKCGGAILNSNHILTSYSCIGNVQRISDLSVVSGTAYLNLGGNTHSVDGMYWVNGTNGTSQDIAILKLADDISYDTYEEPIALATSRPPSDVYAVVSGWGSNSNSAFTSSNRQRYLYVKIIDSLQCNNVFNDVTDEICTLNSAEQGVCYGDGGDPLVYDNKVVGVLSRGRLCAQGFPDVFASVADNLITKSIMSRKLVTLLSFAAIACASVDGAARLVNGQNALPGQFPYTVSLRVENSHICGGAIIDNYHILTAAHCVRTLTNYPDQVYVVTGTIYLDQGGEYHRVAEMFSHPLYDGVTRINNDIGVIKLIDPINFNAFQMPISLPSGEPVADDYAVVSAWGDRSSPPDAQLSNTQQYEYLRMLSLDQCQQYSNLDVDSSMICTYDGPGTGLCPGDSGSPLVFNNQVVGVVSRGYPCARGEPDVFTDVYANIDFVHEAMQY